MGYVDNGGDSICIGEEDIWELNSIPSVQVCYEPKTVLKSKACKKSHLVAFEIPSA